MISDSYTQDLRVLVIDGSEVIRTGLSVMLSAIPHVQEVVTSSTPGAAMGQLDTSKVTCILISSSFEGADTTILRDEAERSNIRYLITYSDSSDVHTAEFLHSIKNGALLLNTLTTDLLARTLGSLSSGQSLLPAELISRLRDHITSATPAANQSFIPVLTAKEAQVLHFLADGLSNKQIGRRMMISEHAVKRHVSNLLAKFNAPNRTQVVFQAIQSGMIARQS